MFPKPPLALNNAAVAENAGCNCGARKTVNTNCGATLKVNS